MSKRAPSRRAVLGSGGSLLLLTAAAAGQAKAQELDGDLLNLCAAHQQTYGQYQRLATLWDEMGSRDPAYVAAELGWRRLQSDAAAIWDEIAGIPAKTPEGLRAKASVMLQLTFEPAHSDLDDPYDVMAWSVLQDIVGRPA